MRMVQVVVEQVVREVVGQVVREVEGVEVALPLGLLLGEGVEVEVPLALLQVDKEVVVLTLDGEGLLLFARMAAPV